MLNEASVWEIMLPKMPMLALIRNLAKMATLGLLDDQKTLDLIVNRISSKEAVEGSKVIQEI
jgi:hypothetical protein